MVSLVSYAHVQETDNQVPLLLRMVVQLRQ